MIPYRINEWSRNFPDSRKKFIPFQCSFEDSLGFMSRTRSSIRKMTPSRNVEDRKADTYTSDIRSETPPAPRRGLSQFLRERSYKRLDTGHDAHEYVYLRLAIPYSIPPPPPGRAYHKSKRNDRVILTPIRDAASWLKETALIAVPILSGR